MGKMKPTLESLLDNFRDRGAERVAFRPGNAHTLRDMPAWQYSLDDFRAGHDALAPLLVKLVRCWKDIPPLTCEKEGFWERIYDDRMRRVWAFNEAVTEIETALAQGSENREMGEKR